MAPLTGHRLKSVLLVGGVAGEFEVRQADGTDDDLVRANGGRSFEALGAAVGDEIILIDAVAADAETADQRAIAIERRAPGKNTIPLFLSLAAPVCAPCVQGLARSCKNKLKNGPGCEPSMPGG